MVNPETLVAALGGNAKSTTEATRLKIQDSLRGAAEAIETPHDTMLRFFNQQMEITVIRAGCDLGLFKALSASERPLSSAELAASANANTLLVGRLLRYLASIRVITETGKDSYASNNVSQALADPRIHDAMYYTFNIGGPAYQALPDFLKEHNYENRTGGKCAWQKGFNTDMDFFPWAKQHPESLGWFQSLMSVPREGDWLDVVPFDKEAASVGEERALFVDVGGSIGHQSARLRHKYPQLPGRIIVQDLEETIKNAPAVPGVEFMTHNFFNEQPVKGARYYYLRTVLHDWEDDKGEEILRNIVPAMAPDSQILIDEMVLPTTGAHWFSACLDLHMYTMLGAMERNVDQWKALLDRAGLRLVELRTYMQSMSHSIIVAEPK